MGNFKKFTQHNIDSKKFQKNSEKIEKLKIVIGDAQALFKIKQILRNRHPNLIQNKKISCAASKSSHKEELDKLIELV